LWEISLVTFPANELARVTDVKSEDDARHLHRTLRRIAEDSRKFRQRNMDPMEKFIDNLKTMEISK
jgi:phage head maturation protease